MGYFILMDANTRTYYMEKNNVRFFAFTAPSRIEELRKNARLVETDIEDIEELETVLYNAGFFHGYIDGKPYKLSKPHIYYYNRNPNEIAYAQYLLTRDEKYKESIKKNKLYTFCKIDGDSIFYPIATDEDGTRLLLTYTDRLRITQVMFEKYKGWRSIKVGDFQGKCVVNGELLID